ncbi:hypothetical protein A9970_03640 [Sphingobacterium sp. UME9]|nr:hypothetical protein [Sphingobacterium sp. UME9]
MKNLREQDQENFWIWFHPCYQTSQDLADLNIPYKQVKNGWFDYDVMEIFNSIKKPPLLIFKGGD